MMSCTLWESLALEFKDCFDRHVSGPVVLLLSLAKIIEAKGCCFIGVSIGPFCFVSSSAKLGNDCQLYPGSHLFVSTELGDNCTLMIGAFVGDDHPGCTVIGSNNTIGYHAVIGVKCQDMKYKLFHRL
ncbi:hypothetical protein JHK85_053218 [Glycine max]|nr:hypothetical protein JHK85_053218 [Glycine max]